METIPAVDESTARLKKALLHDIRRSAYVYRVDCGGCNGCEIEIFAAISPVFDAERFGIKVVSSPRHADILLYTGAMTRSMRVPALRAYEAAPEPKIVMSYGACGCTGGIFHDLYCVWGGTDKIIPADVYVPGCPPSPAATLYGFAVALGLLEQKLHRRSHVEADNERVLPAHPLIPYDLRVRVQSEARIMAGYRAGYDIAEKFFAFLETPSSGDFATRVDTFAEQQEDPRVGEVIRRIAETFQHEGLHT